MLDIEKLMDGIAQLVAKAVSDAVAPLNARIASLEKSADAAPVSVASAVIDRDGDLILTFSDGQVKSLGRVVGAPGKDGDDGEDGLGFEDLSLTIDDVGRVQAVFARGDLIKTCVLPGLVDRGVYRAGETYQKGDVTTWGGSLWIAQTETSDKPDSGTGWRLAVKKGRDGREAR